MAKKNYSKEPKGQNYKLSFTGTEIAALNMALRNYYNREIFGPKILKKKSLSFEDEVVKSLKNFFEKENLPTF